MSFADWEIENSSARTGFLDRTRFTADRIGFSDIGNRAADSTHSSGEALPRLPEWQTYHCFVADLRYADLRAADFENGSLAGADLAYADLSGANLCGVDASRARFTGAKGLTSQMLEQVCAGPDAQPIGLEKALPKGTASVRLCSSLEKKAAGRWIREVPMLRSTGRSGR